MTTATGLPPTVPPPAGCGEPFTAPAPVRCHLCRGNNQAACERCLGVGFEKARFDLPASRTYGLRRVRYEPSAVRGEGRLFVCLAKHKQSKMRWTEYALCETVNDWGGRSWVCAKVGTDRVHNVFVGKSVACECEGASYLSASKANQRAHESGEATYPIYGCVHQCSIVALVLGGWFDLKGDSDGT